MLRRDTPKGDRSELNELLRRVAGPRGSVTLSLGGEPIARFGGGSAGPVPPAAPARRERKDAEAHGAPRPGED